MDSNKKIKNAGMLNDNDWLLIHPELNYNPSTGSAFIVQWFSPQKTDITRLKTSLSLHNNSSAKLKGNQKKN